MKSRRQNWNSQQLNLKEWQKLYYLNQQSYLRKRLLAIKLLFDGKTRTEVLELVNCTYKTLTTWIDKYLEGGLSKLTESIKHQAP